MSEDRLDERIADQFSYRGEHGDIWRGFDLVLDTEEYLNLGYSKWYLPYVLGAPQRRLAATVGTGLGTRLDGATDVSILDVGCGRGGPSVHLAATYGFDVTGLDLVPYNVEIARENATRRGVEATFVVGDTMQLPFRSDAFDACTAVDSVVYMPEKGRVFENIARVVRSGGVVAISDLVMKDVVETRAHRAVDAFTASWDMSNLSTVEEYRRDLEDAGLAVESITDLSSNSIDRFRKWAWLYLALARHANGTLDSILHRWDIDEAAVTKQVRDAYRALPHLRHVLVYARP